MSILERFRSRKSKRKEELLQIAKHSCRFYEAPICPHVSTLYDCPYIGRHGMKVPDYCPQPKREGILLLLLCLLLWPVGVWAATAAWQANTEADLAGYHLYRAVGSCADPGAFALVNTYEKTAVNGVIVNPPNDGLYCHKLTAFDTSSNESLFSNSVEFTYNVIPPQAPQGLTVAP